MRVQPKEVFAKNVKAERDRQDITQETLATRTRGLSLPQVNRVEKAVYDPQLLTIVKIAQGLGVPAGELLKGL